MVKISRPGTTIPPRPPNSAIAARPGARARNESKIRWWGFVCESRINALPYPCPYPFGSITAESKMLQVVGSLCVNPDHEMLSHLDAGVAGAYTQVYDSVSDSAPSRR